MRGGLLECRGAQVPDLCAEFDSESSLNFPTDTSNQLELIEKALKGESLADLSLNAAQGRIVFLETYGYVAPHKVAEYGDYLIVASNGRTQYVWGDRIQVINRDPAGTPQRKARFADFGDVLDLKVTEDARVVALLDVPYQEPCLEAVQASGPLLKNRHRLEVISFPLSDPEDYSVLLQTEGRKWSSKWVGALKEDGSTLAVGNEEGILSIIALPEPGDILAAPVPLRFQVPTNIKHLQFIPGERCAVMCLSGKDEFSPGDTLCIVDADTSDPLAGIVKYAAPKTSDSLHFDDGISAIQLDRRGSTLAVGTRGAVGIYRLEGPAGDRHLIHEASVALDGSTEVTALAFSGNGRFLAVAASDGTVRIMSRNERHAGVLQELWSYSLEGDEMKVTSLEFLRDDSELAIGSHTRSLQTDGPYKGEYALRILRINEIPGAEALFPQAA